MRNKPFIGIVLQSMEEVRAVFPPTLPSPSLYDYMVVLGGVKTGDVIELPKVAAVRAIYMGDARKLKAGLMANMLRAVPSCNAFFLEGFPDPFMLDTFKANGSIGRGVDIIAHATSDDLRYADDDPGPIARQLARYGGTVNYASFNPAGSIGRDYYAEFTRRMVRRLSQAGAYGVCVSGGISESNLEQLCPLFREFPKTSIVAGEQLRNPQTRELDIARAHRYLKYAGELYDKYLVAA